MFPAVPLSFLFLLLVHPLLTRATHFDDANAQHLPPNRRWISSHRLEEWTHHSYHKNYRAAIPLQKKQETGGSRMIEVTETSVDIPSSLGMMTQKCMTLVSDPTQSFCTTFLNGQNIGSDSGLGAAAAIESAGGSGVAASAGIASSSDDVVAALAAPSETSGALSAEIASVSSATSTSTATSTSIGESAISTSVSLESGPTTTITSSFGAVESASASSTSISIDVVVNNPSAPATSAQPSDVSSLDPATVSPSISEASAAPLQLSSRQPSDTALSTLTSTFPETSPTSSVDPTSINLDSVVVVNDPTSAPPAATAAAAEADQTTTPIPGQKLQVLPIGLGIFGGLVVLTLAVVGYVFYERRKYKLQFRRRKDEEKASFASRGANMGYTA